MTDKEKDALRHKYSGWPPPVPKPPVQVDVEEAIAGADVVPLKRTKKKAEEPAE